MDSMARRRIGKGNGSQEGETSQAAIENGSGEASGSSNSLARPIDVVGTEHGQETGVLDPSVGNGDMGRASGSTPNPFWSERARDELRLAAARPDFLGSAGIQQESASSASTELRPVGVAVTSLEGPAGPPTVFSPPGMLQTTVGEGSAAVDSVENRAQEARGLNAREREVLSAMKDAMIRISQQNEQLMSQNEALWQRVLGLEEERSTNHTAYHSAQDPMDGVDQNGSVVEVSRSSGIGDRGTQDQGEGDRETIGVMKYEQGYQQGYLAAKEALEAAQTQEPHCVSTVSPLDPISSPAPSFGPGNSRDRERTPPPNPFRTLNLQCNTTPKGTPVPSGPPPSSVGIGCSTPADNLPKLPGFPAVGSSAWHSNELERGPSLCAWQGYAGMNAPPPMPPLRLASRTVAPQYGPSGNADAGVDPWGGGVPERGDGGRDPYAPGDRVYWTLPVLDDPTLPEAATRAADWLELVRPLMADLAQSSATWWRRVEWEARTLYVQWTSMSAINRGLLVPSMSVQLSDVRFQKLESRAFAKLQAALPAAVKDELLATRSLTTVSAIFVTLKLYAPGGLAERNELLDSLTNLGIAKTSQDAVSQIRRWHRSLARAQAMGVAVPDPARLIKGLDGLSETLLKRHTQVAFRLSQARTVLQLDHVPNMSSVQEYARIVQSEWEMIAVSGADEGNKPKIARMDQEDPKNGGKGKKGEKTKGEKNETASEPGKGEGEGPKAGGKAAGKGEGKPCTFYLTQKGCSKGRACTFVHNFGKAKGESRCYNCGSTEHRQQECTRPTSGGKPSGEAGGKGRGGKSPAQAPALGSDSQGHTAAPNVPSNLNPASNTNPVPPNKSTGYQQQGGTTVPGGVPANQTSGKAPGQTEQSVASAQAQVLEEAQKLLKSLRIAAVRVPDESREDSPERVSAGRHVPEGTVDPEEERPEEEVPRSQEIFVPAVSIRRSRMPTGLLDGGATHALRTAGPGEWELATPTRVALAVGSQDLRISATGTVLSQNLIAPIAPLGLLVDLLGCRVTWDSGRCTVIHPTKGDLGVWLEDNCPVVSEEHCLELISEIEQYRAARLDQALQIRALGLGVELGSSTDNGSLWGSDRDLAVWLKDRFPEAPDWLLLRSLPVRCGVGTRGPYDLPGLNRRARKALKRAKHIVLHVFSGKTKPLEFSLGSDVVVVNLDVLLGSNVLDERVYAAAAALCGTGKVDAVLGGPPCCTNSLLRERGVASPHGGSDGGPRPVRGRTGMLRFGLPSNTPDEQRKVEEHTILVTRFLTLHHIADVSNPRRTLCALENPQDPMTYLPESRKHDEIPSIWAWPEIMALLEGSAPDGDNAITGKSPSDTLAVRATHSWFLAQFDQGALGHAVRKPTAVLTNDWELFQDIHERRGSGFESAIMQHADSLGDRIRKSSSWAKWAPGLCRAVGNAIRKWIGTSEKERRESESEGRVALKALTKRELEFRKHCEDGHIIFRRDCRACLEGQMKSHVHRRQKHQGSNTFCLSMDLVGPWKPGRDHVHGQPVTRFLIASLSVPLPEGQQDVDRLSERRESEHQGFEGGESDDLDDYEHGEKEDPEMDGDPHEEDIELRRQRAEEAWRKEAEKLQDPVPVHDLIFCEPLTSKKASEVLRAIQRVWVRILGLGLTVRRLHTDGGREFCNQRLEAWALARDLRHTFSVPSDPKSNGRIENWVKHAKAGVRTLLCTMDNKDTAQWPSALRQWAEQRLRKSLKLLHVPDPIRPLPPFGTTVVVKNRQWSRKTPHDAKAMTGKVMCPAANIPNTSVLLLDNGQFYVAPVVYQGVLESPHFEGHVAPDVPPAPAPPHRITKKTNMTTKGRGESGFSDLDSGIPDGDEEAGLLGCEDAVGDAGSGGVGDAAEGDEFEGMVPDSVLFGDVGLKGLRVCNLWCEELTCNLREAPRTPEDRDTCRTCGTWQGRTLSLEESEQYARRLLEAMLRSVGATLMHC